MESKTDALVLRTADYGEYDRMVTLLTAERGKIGAALKGVRRAGAKLRFAAQPFCFAEYVLAARGGRNTVVSAALHDGFYALREDVTAYYAGAIVLSAADAVALEGMESGRLLVSAVTALEGISQGDVLAVPRFLTEALAFAGYPVSAGACPACGRLPSGRLRFDFATGAFFCDGCFPDGTPASGSTFAAVRALAGEGEATQDGIVRAVRLLGAYFAYQVGTELKEIPEYLRLLRS